jgi:penicillin-binding protein 1B
MRSLNNATIGLASMVGFDRVAALARDAGIKSARERRRWPSAPMTPRRSTWPARTPIFANGGVHIDPWMLASVRTSTGDIIDRLHADHANRCSIRA